MFLFAFGDHHHRDLRINPFDLLQRLQPCHAGHVFVQKNNVDGGLVAADGIDRILSVAGSYHVVPFSFQINDVRLQQIDFIVHPKYLFLVYTTLKRLFHSSSIC
jgi:hypothetical protein